MNAACEALIISDADSIILQSEMWKEGVCACASARVCPPLITDSDHRPSIVL